MGFYVRRSVKIAPGLRLYFSKNGVDLSAGVKGFHISRSATGRTTLSAGIPGTGLSYRETLSGTRGRTSPSPRPPAVPDRDAGNESTGFTSGEPDAGAAGGTGRMPGWMRAVRGLAWLVALVVGFGAVGTVLTESESFWSTVVLVLTAGIAIWLMRLLWRSRHWRPLVTSPNAPAQLEPTDPSSA